MTTELFMDAFTDNGGSQCMDCELCGVTHFTHESDDYEKLLAKEKEQPTKYREDRHNDSLAWGYLDGKQWVWGCQCGKADRYEEFVWSHREQIAKYLKARAAEELKRAQWTQGQVQSLGGTP